MKEYIDKAAIKAELEKRIKVCQDYAKCNLTENTRIGNKAQHIELNDILSFLDTLEVKETLDSDDLEQEIENELERTWCGEYLDTDKFRESAKHFFELGLKAQKGE